MARFHRLGELRWLGGGRAARVIGGRAARITGLAGLGILGVALLAGAIRVLPWIVAPGVPFRVALPFARALFAIGLEATFLCAPSIGWALSAAKLIERGEARALLALGLRPARIVGASLVPALGFAMLTGLAALASGTEAAAPGRLARSLVEQSRRSCEGAGAPRVTDVPFVGVTWLCFADHPPRVTGSLPGGDGTFTAANLTISDDLRSLHFSDMRLLFGASGDVRVHTAQADVKGLSPWGRSSNVRPVWRAALVACTGMALALLASLAVLARSVSHRVASLLMGAAGPAAALVVLARLEQGDHLPVAYLAVPLAGLLALSGVTFLVWLMTRRRAPALPHDRPGARPT